MVFKVESVWYSTVSSRLSDERFPVVRTTCQELSFNENHSFAPKFAVFAIDGGDERRTDELRGRVRRKDTEERKERGKKRNPSTKPAWPARLRD